jgi:hypothetical protein
MHVRRSTHKGFLTWLASRYGLRQLLFLQYVQERSALNRLTKTRPAAGLSPLIGTTSLHRCGVLPSETDDAITNFTLF